MIAKQYRLTERELRKVLSRKKPFFSYLFIANVLPNRLDRGRCAILLSSKVAKGSVNRNFWRRQFYDTIREYVQTPSSFDIVIVPKKGILLDHKNENQLVEFKKNIQFLCRKIQASPSESQKI